MKRVAAVVAVCCCPTAHYTSRCRRDWREKVELDHRGAAAPEPAARLGM